MRKEFLIILGVILLHYFLLGLGAVVSIFLPLLAKLVWDNVSSTGGSFLIKARSEPAQNADVIQDQHQPPLPGIFALFQMVALEAYDRATDVISQSVPAGTSPWEKDFKPTSATQAPSSIFSPVPQRIFGTASELRNRPGGCSPTPGSSSE